MTSQYKVLSFHSGDLRNTRHPCEKLIKDRVKNKVLLIVIGFLLCHCTGIKKDIDKPIVIVNLFDANEVNWFKSKGTGSIKGIAKFKSKDGELRYGEEFRIELMPKCLYTEERLSKIYPSKNSGFIYVEDGIPTFTPDPKEYHDTLKTMCNKDGEFEFQQLPEGEYYVIAFMLWGNTGGGIMQHLVLSEGETKVIEMTNF